MCTLSTNSFKINGKNNKNIKENREFLSQTSLEKIILVIFLLTQKLLTINCKYLKFYPNVYNNVFHQNI